jgi:hypothetical protein
VSSGWAERTVKNVRRDGVGDDAGGSCPYKRGSRAKQDRTAKVIRSRISLVIDRKYIARPGKVKPPSFAGRGGV